MPELDSSLLLAPLPLYIRQRTLIDECRIYVFFTLFGYWVRARGGGSPKGLVHNLLMQFFTLATQISKFSDIDFFGNVTTYNDHPRYVKHVLSRMNVFSPYLGSGSRGGGGGSEEISTQMSCADPKGSVHNLPMQIFTLGGHNNQSFLNYFFEIVTT